MQHDIWDRDFPAAPTLVTVRRNGKDVPAIAQTSKQGYLYLFNRLAGTPLFPIEYRRYPASSVPGEVTAREQGLATKPLPFSRQRLTEDLLTTRTPEAHQWALEHFRTLISDGQFIPASVGKETVMFSGWVGGGEYGGAAIDPETHILYINANDDALTTGLVKTIGGAGGHALYASQCAACHGQDRTGSPPSIPSLVDIGQRLTPTQIMDVLEHGRGRMPSFASLTVAEREGVVKFLLHGEGEEAASSSPSTYNTTGYHMFVDPDGYPAVATPWGTLNAIYLDTGDYMWKVPFGEYPELAAQGVKNTGSESFGGPVVTVGGCLSSRLQPSIRRCAFLIRLAGSYCGRPRSLSPLSRHLPRTRSMAVSTSLSPVAEAGIAAPRRAACMWPSHSLPRSRGCSKNTS